MNHILVKKQLRRFGEVLMLIVTVSLLSLLAEAKVYKWKDNSGNWQYSDIPPVDVENAQMFKTHKYQSVTNQQKGQGKSKQSKSKPTLTVDAENAEVMQQNCEGAKANLTAYSIGGRIRRSDKYGQMVYLNEQEIAKAKATAEKQVEQYCR